MAKTSLTATAVSTIDDALERLFGIASPQEKNDLCVIRDTLHANDPAPAPEAPAEEEAAPKPKRRRKKKEDG